MKRRRYIPEVLLIHGTKDKSVPYTCSAKLHEALLVGSLDGCTVCIGVCIGVCWLMRARRGVRLLCMGAAAG